MTRGMMGRFATAAGGVDTAEALVPGEAGVVNLEWLLANPPEVYIGSAASGAKKPRLSMGAGVSETLARASLARSLKRAGIADLPPVRNGRAHAIWHHFYNSPFNVVAVQAFAKWLHPTLFADLDPEATLRDLHARFQPFAVEGAYWVSLK